MKTVKKSVGKSTSKTLVSTVKATEKTVALRDDNRAIVGRLNAQGVDGSSVWNSARNKKDMFAWLASRVSSLKSVKGEANASLKCTGKMGVLFWKVALSSDRKTYTRRAPEGVLTGSIDCLKVGKIAVEILPLAKVGTEIAKSAVNNHVGKQEVELYFPKSIAALNVKGTK